MRRRFLAVGFGNAGRVITLLCVCFASVWPAWADSLPLPGDVAQDAEIGRDEEASPPATGPFAAADAESRIASDVRYLASDRLRGRGLFDPSIDEVAHYIADSFAAAGLELDAALGTPFQDFTVRRAVLGIEPRTNYMRFALGKPDTSITKNVSATSMVDCKIGEDFRVLSFGGSGQVRSPLVFAGYGITAQETGFHYDDYADVDVSGKIVLILRKEPGQADANSRLDGAKSSEHSYFLTKYENARKHGAAAVLFVNDETSIVENPDGVCLDPLPPGDVVASRQTTGIPCLFVTREIADTLLAHSIGESLSTLESRINERLQPQSQPLPGVTIELASELVDTALSGRNVIGVLPGRGALAGQSVIVGAHYDHIGLGGQGSLAYGVTDIHNGADDNASGVAALLELARRLGDDERTGDRRRVVFIAFSGEERGLLGSKHYVREPTLPLSQVAAMINLDMVGRMGAGGVIVYGIGSSPVFDTVVRSAAEAADIPYNPQRPAYGPSDHRPFFEERIPVLHFFTGIHPQYHRPSDDFVRINLNGIERITDMVYHAIDDLAVRPSKPPFYQVAGRANIFIETEESGKLGVRLQGDRPEAVITQVADDSPAEKAGLIAGDQVIAVDGKAVADWTSLVETIAARRPGDRVVLTVQRGSTRQEISVELGR